MKTIFLLVIMQILFLMQGCGDIKENVSDSTVNMYSETEKGTDVIEQEELEETEKLYEEVVLADIAYDVIGFSCERAWAQIEGIWCCIDPEGNIIFDLPVGAEPMGSFVANLCMVNDRYLGDIILDKDGNVVLEDYISEDDQILLLGTNNGEANIWVKTIIDTYDSHSVQLKVLDERGNILAEFRPNEVMQEKEMGVINERGRLWSNGNGMYSYGMAVFNVNNGSMFRYEYKDWHYEGTGCGLSYNDGYGVDAHGNLIDQNGNVIISNEGKGVCGGIYSEGMYFVGNMEEISYKNYGYRGKFYDNNGEVALDISQYLLINCPSFVNGCCVLQMVNENAVKFVTVIDKSGNFLLEPIEGSIESTNLYEGILVVRESQIYQIVDFYNDKKIELPQGTKVERFCNGWARYRKSYPDEYIFGFMDREGNDLKIRIE